MFQLLDGQNESLTLVLAGAKATVDAVYAVLFDGGRAEGTSNGTSLVTMLTGSAKPRPVQALVINNADSAAITATLALVSDASRNLFTITLQAGDLLLWDRNGFRVVDSSGQIRQKTSAVDLTASVLVFAGATGINEIQVPTNLVDALSLESSAGDIFTVDTSTGAVVFNFGANVRLNVLGSFQGGNATADLVAFHGSTPTDQCAAYTQTFATADRTHANATGAPAALTAANPAAVTEYTAHASGAVPVTSNAATDLDTTAAALNTLVDECQAVETEVSALVADGVTQKAVLDAVIVDLADLKQLVNAIIDDLQEKGLVG